MRTNVKRSIKAPVTHEGGRAKVITLEQELRRSVLACLLFEGSFYESGASIADRIANLASKVDADKVRDLALEARTSYNLRHAPLWLLIALAKRHYPNLGNAIYETIGRVDEIPELLSLWFKSQPVQLKVNNHPSIPAQLKKGLARAFNSFDQYQISKYQMWGADISLRDAMFLTHPNPTKNETRDVAKMPAVYKQLANNELAAPDNTWEKVSSSMKFDSDKAKWEHIIDMWITE